MEDINELENDENLENTNSDGVEKLSKKEEKLNELNDEFDKIQEDNDVDVNKYLAKLEDLQNLGEIQIYDYDSDSDDAKKIATDVIQSLGEFYLGDTPDLLNHKYIQNKLKEDAMIYAETLFLTKMTQKNFLTQLRQVDNGDQNARMHEVINQTIREIRENSKFKSTQKTELEKFYKEIRNDIGAGSLSEKNNIVTETKETDNEDGGGKIIDTMQLNDMIDKLKNRKS